MKTASNPADPKMKGSDPKKKAAGKVSANTAEKKNKAPLSSKKESNEINKADSQTATASNVSKSSATGKETQASESVRHATEATSRKTSSRSEARKAPSQNAAPKDVTAEFREFFLEELKDIYWAEKALVKVLPDMSENASAPKLVNALNSHLQETERQVIRLEKVFELLGEEPDTKTCKAMKGLIEEAKDIIDDVDEDLIRDAGIILASQKVEHYEIATYGTLIAFAKLMGQQGVVSLLEQTLQEEKGADSKLTELAESFINDRAATESTTAEPSGYSGFVRKWIFGNF